MPSATALTAAALDADLNHSLTDWINQHHPSFEVRAEIDETRIVPMVSALHEMHDLVVIDTAGAATQATVFAIGCADLVLIPLKLSAADVTEAIRTMALVKSAVNHDEPRDRGPCRADRLQAADVGRNPC